MDRRDYLKPTRFGNHEQRRLLETKNLKDKRSIRRTTNFNLRRDLDQEVKENTRKNVLPKKDPVLDRKLQLQKFKADKEAQRKALKDKKKPPFVVGIPHHGSSPLLKDLSAKNNKKENKATVIQEVRSKRVTRTTRATTKAIQENVLREKPKTNEQSRNVFKAPPLVKVFPFTGNKTGFSFQPHKVLQSAKKLTSPHTPTVLKRSAQKKPLTNLSNFVTKGKRSPKNAHLNDTDEVLAAPLPKTEEVDETQGQEETGLGVSEAPKDGRESSQNVSLRVSETRIKVEENEVEVSVQKVEDNDEGINSKVEDNEVANEVAFQHGRLELETTRLLGLADQWGTVVIRESVPHEVVDEVDSVVGQTRLLTSDKFQQFRKLIVQFENKTGTHPVSLDDLNGFWDMVYLQVEALDKKYASLDILKNNSWVNPEPVNKKKQRTAKKPKVNKVPEVEKSAASKKSKNQNSSQPTEDQEVQTPTTNLKPVISSVLLNKKRTRSNSPSPFIAMRLSGVGRISSIMGQPPGTTDGTPRNISTNTTEVHGTPKSALKKSLVKLSESTRKRRNLLSTTTSFEAKIEETDHLTAAQEELTPAITPRKSIRLMLKQQPTPVHCTACDSANCDRSMCPISSTYKSSTKRPRTSQKKAVSPFEGQQEKETKPDSDTRDSVSRSTRRPKKILTYSPSESQQERNSPTVTDLNKPSTSGVRFSLRPSILTISTDSDVTEIPKKTKKRRQASVFTLVDTNVEPAAEGSVGAKRQHNTRQSRKVTFESVAEEKSSFKLPATPYRKSQADS